MSQVNHYEVYIQENFLDLFVPQDQSKTLVVYLPGLPSSHSQQEFLKKLSQNGFSTALLRYTGAEKSKGSFPNKKISENIIEVFNKLKEGISIENSIISFDEIIIIGSSFGSFVGLDVLKKDPALKKIILFSPLTTIKNMGSIPGEESITELKKLVLESGNYRVNDNFDDLLNDSIIKNQLGDLNLLKEKKIFIVHSENDRIISPKRVDDLLNKLKIEGINFQALSLNLGHSFTKKLDHRSLIKIIDFIKND